MGVLRKRPVEVQVRQVDLSDLTSTLNSTSAKAYTHLTHSLLTATPGKGKDSFRFSGTDCAQFLGQAQVYVFVCVV